MLRAVGVVAAAVVVMVTGWATSLPAQAGGPTSVLLSSPADQQVRALYYTDRRYERLADAVGASLDPGTSTASPPGVSADREVRLTWLIHDMSVWRIDRVHLGDDGIWVETRLRPTGQGDIFAQPGRWRRAPDEQALVSLLSSLGLAGGASEQTGAPLRAATPTSAVGPALLAGAVGLLAGVGGSLLLLRRAGSRRG